MSDTLFKQVNHTLGGLAQFIELGTEAIAGGAAEGVVADITLKDAKPAAKVLGLTIPQSLPARSDEWIR